MLKNLNTFRLAYMDVDENFHGNFEFKQIRLKRYI